MRHAMIIHDRVLEEITELSKVYTSPVKMQKLWDEAHMLYVENVAWIKQMLSM